MKLLCTSCDRSMDYVRHGLAGEESIEIGFKCPACGREVVMVTNPGETRIVSSFGVDLGGRAESAPPMQVTTSSLRTETPGPDEIQWHPAAKERLSNVPEFARPMAKQAIERYARENGVTLINVSVMDKVKATIGH